jgi:hypothetical protein
MRATIPAGVDVIDALEYRGVERPRGVRNFLARAPLASCRSTVACMLHERRASVVAQYLIVRF